MNKRVAVLALAASAALLVPAGTTAQAGGEMTYEKAITIRLNQHLFATGHIDAERRACRSLQPVIVQKERPSGEWRNVRSVTTNRNGDYFVEIPDIEGNYRAKTTRQEYESGIICLRARSGVRKHLHP